MIVAKVIGLVVGVILFAKIVNVKDSEKQKK